MNPLFKIFGIQETLVQFNHNIKKLGWSRACARLLKELRINTQSNLSDFPKKGGVIIYANHPTGLDPYIISSILPRDDVYILSDIYQAKKGDNVAKHILPIYYANWLEFWRRPLIGWPGYIIMRFITGTVDSQKAYENNKKSLTRVFLLVKKGHVVLIFPSGGESQKRPWKRGLAKLITQLQEEKISYTLYAVLIKRLSEIKMLYHVMGGRKFFLDNPIHLRGSKIGKENLPQTKNFDKLSSYLRRQLESLHQR